MTADHPTPTTQERPMSHLPYLLTLLPAGLCVTVVRYRTRASRSRDLQARISDYTDPRR